MVRFPFKAYFRRDDHFPLLKLVDAGLKVVPEAKIGHILGADEVPGVESENVC